MADFSITSNELIDYTISMQKINAVALPIAMQEALNGVAKHTKKVTLDQSVNKEFDIKKKSFFKSNSAFKLRNAKESNYNINKMYSEVGITKGKKANEKATEQVGSQQTATPIKRSINPLGNKPQTKKVIDILSKKPEFVSFEKGDNESINRYIRGAHRAKRRGAPLVVMSGSRGTGAVNRVKTLRKRKPTKANPKRFIIKLENIASYHKGGTVKLRKKAPFLNNAAISSTKEKLNDEFIRAAERQVELAWKRR